MEGTESGRSHNISFINRKSGVVTGVKDVISFDLSKVLLETDYGMMNIKGHDLHVDRLSVEKGELSLSGTIDSISYTEVGNSVRKNESVWARLFK